MFIISNKKENDHIGEKKCKYVHMWTEWRETFNSNKKVIKSEMNTVYILF